MDPNATLAEIRILIKRVDNAKDYPTVAERNEQRALAGTYLVDAIEGLDGWLSRGGFLPDAWQRETGEQS